MNPRMIQPKKKKKIKKKKKNKNKSRRDVIIKRKQKST